MDTNIKYIQMEEHEVSAAPNRTSRLEKASFITLLVALILAPLAFLPILYAPVDVSKTIVIAFGVLISSILYLFALLKQKNIQLPKHPLIFALCGVVVSSVVSTFLSTSIVKSFSGQGFELGAASFFFVLMLAMVLTTLLARRDSDRIVYIYGAIIVSFVILALYHILRFIFGADFLDFGIFQSTISTLAGRWNDVAILAGAIAIISYLGLSLISERKLFKLLLRLLLVVSGVFMFIVNFAPAWLVLALIFAAITYYDFKRSSVRGFRRLSILPALIVLIALACVWKGDSLVVPVHTALKIDQVEIVLPWQVTLDIASQTLKESPFFGAGLNRFGVQYLKFKPSGINEGSFWNTEFNGGSGILLTSLTTQGIVGFIFWCVFIIFLVAAGRRTFKRAQDDLARFLAGSTFALSFFLWVVSFVFIPSHALMFITFIVTGLFLSVLISNGDIKLVQLSSSENPRMHKVILIFVIVMILACAVWTLAYVKKTVAFGYFQAGISALKLPQGEGVARAEDSFKKALLWNKNDGYYQALSEVTILKMDALAQKIQTQIQQGAKTPDQADIKNLNDLVALGLAYSEKAIAFDPTNYYNYVSEARISEAALALKIPSSYEKIQTVYAQALRYNPFNPALYLNLARIDVSQDKFAEAQKNIGFALQLKQNYTEAIFLLSQIQVSQGQIKEAITSVQVAAQINPSNPLVFFQLGILYYNDKNYQEAVNSFDKALQLDSQYANARYFLGLSYARLGRTADALKEFESLALTNPDNAEVVLILSNLKAGKSVFADALPPIDSKPEQRSSLPLKEKASVTKKK